MKSIEYFIKNILLKLLILFSKSRKKVSLNFNSHSKILFIRLNRIGDALITTTLLHIVKSKLKCSVYVLADKKNYFIFKNNPSVDDVIIFDKSLHSFSKINNLIKEKNIDTIIDLHDDVSTTVSFLLKYAKVNQILGLERSNHKLYTNTVNRINPGKNHVIARNIKLCELLKIEYELKDVRVHFYPTKSSLDFADTFFKKVNPETKFQLGINISAGSMARFWGIENFQKLLEIIKAFNISITIFSTPELQNIASKIIDKKFIYSVSDDFNIFAAGISKLNLLFTPDTSSVHIASAYNIPVFGLYVKYNTEDMIWSPYNTPFDCVITKEPTLKNINFDKVKQKFIPFLERYLNA